MTEQTVEQRIQELEQKRDLILARNQGWLSCQDGSYEMALHYAGYDKVVAELAELKAKQQ